MESEYDNYFAKLRKKKWKISDIPGYEKGKAVDTTYWHTTDYKDEYATVWGRACGGNGIGRLREVGMTKITPYEVKHLKWYREQDPNAESYGFLVNGADPRDFIPNYEKWVEQQENWAKVLKENGVKLYWIGGDHPFGDPPVGPFGPWTYTWTKELLTVRGGNIISRHGISPVHRGRSEWTARWLLWYLGIPIQLTVTGKGVSESGGAAVWLAEDVFVPCLGPACNQEALDQIVPALKRTSPAGENLKVVAIRAGFSNYLDYSTGVGAHADMIINALDLGKVIIYPPAIDYDTHVWLRRNHFEIVNVSREEHLRAWPCNLVPLAPGKVAMHAEAKESIKKVRKLGVDVIEVPFSEYLKTGGGLHCATGIGLLRDVGPYITEFAK